MTTRWIDCRDLSIEEIISLGKTRNETLLLTAAQCSRAYSISNNIKILSSAVVLPDFVRYARLLSTGQFRSFLTGPGNFVQIMKSLTGLGLQAIKNLPGCAKQDFWCVASALLKYDMAQLPGNFHGTLLLHDSIGDFAWLFEREEIFRLLTRSSKKCKVGVLTQQPAKACSGLARVGITGPVIVAALPYDLHHHPELGKLIEITSEKGWEWVNNLSEIPKEFHPQWETLETKVPTILIR